MASFYHINKNNIPPHPIFLCSASSSHNLPPCRYGIFFSMHVMRLRISRKEILSNIGHLQIRLLIRTQLWHLAAGHLSGDPSVGNTKTTVSGQNIPSKRAVSVQFLYNYLLYVYMIRCTMYIKTRYKYDFLMNIGRLDDRKVFGRKKS
jgi:hypothetical protein